MILDKVPSSLRTWFVIHFIADLVFGLPLLLFPVSTMMLFGWSIIDPLTARLVGAALMGIGIESFLGRKKSIESFHTMLRLKIIWSLAANFGIVLTIYQGAPKAAWLFQGIFVFFSCTWIYYKKRLSRISIV